MIKLNHEIYNVPGILLSVSDKNRVVSHYVSGLGDIKANSLMQSGGLFRCGLITRLFTVGILLRLADEGALDLDLPLELVSSQHQQDNGLLHVLVSQYPFLKPVTVRELLSHTSGIPSFDKTVAYNDIFIAKPRKIWQLENYLDVVSGADVRFQYGYEPKLRGYYGESSTNYLVAGLVIEAVSGVKTSEAMRDLFREFSLNNTHYLSCGVVDKDMFVKMTHGYLPISHPFAPAFEQRPKMTYNSSKELYVYDVTDAYTVNGMGNAAVVSTTGDLISWLQKMMDAEVIVNHYSQLFIEHPVHGFTNGFKDSYCLGFYKSMSKDYGEIIWTAGNSLGFSSFIAHSVNKGITFAMLVNVSRQHFSLHSEGLIADVLQQLL